MANVRDATVILSPQVGAEAHVVTSKHGNAQDIIFDLYTYIKDSRKSRLIDEAVSKKIITNLIRLQGLISKKTI